MALNDEDLISILRREEYAAQNWQDQELLFARKKALDYYNRVPENDLQEGQSQVVTSEFADTIESLMPSLMRVFASGEEVVEFSPMQPGQEGAAKEASQFVPHVLMRENDGFRILYWFFKDALMYRLSAMTVDLEEKEETKTDPIEGWTAEELAMAEEAAQEVEATDVEIKVTEDPYPEPPPGGWPVDPEAGVPAAAPQTYSGTITLTRTRQRCVPDNIAPEDFLCSPGARDIDAASFVGYRKQVTSSQLRIMGLSQADIDELSSDRWYSPEEDQRQEGTSIDTNIRKDSERRFWVVVAYVRADDNDDGISEMLRVVYVHAGGMNGKVIDRQGWEGVASLVAGSPILMSHTIVGRSIFEQVQDLQDIDTQLTRGMLDNLYLTNRPRPAISDKVNINTVLDWTPGMPIQIRGGDNPGNHISWLEVPSVIAPAQGALEYFATVRENRTGVTRYNQGLDADSLNKTASGINMIMSSAQQRQELIARTFAETAIKRLMRLIYRAIKKAAKGPIKYYNGDDWAECDPTKWPDDMHLQTNVALGTGNKQQEMQNLMLVGAGQEKLIMMQGGPDGPLVTQEHVANTFRKLVEAAGFKATGKFVASPKELQSTPPKPPQPSPEMMKVQAQAEADKAKMQTDHQHQMHKLQADQQLAAQKLQIETQQKREQLMADIALKREAAREDMQLQREKHQQDMQLARERAALDARLKAGELAMEAQLEKYAIDNAPKLDEQKVSDD